MTVVVSEMSDEAQAERQQKIQDGARVVPFGFSRALAEPQTPEPSWLDDGYFFA